ncbi:membrane dipeptidase [Paenibacillus sp. PastF-1]|nr:membrane dipeptidase [Paenibacillus sp. PastF-2]MDF9847894.1 membrane dipeptidase [Paenibacillus sp. PastM-2]MDF9854462.1 membrane dipeptidase [Paenibacillus sp. PastF-1]MDH6479929.1 membrane dipeptidase [Paenibacillus sp. PastH-2]MDH6507169.1 membrane dipeptidase [Paenibacillus sp. PastM-3]
MYSRESGDDMGTAAKFKVADFHCDALSKLQAEPDIHFNNDHRLDVTAERLAAGNVGLQVFAVYLSGTLGKPGFERILGQLELFRKRVITGEGLRWLRWKEEAVITPAPEQAWAMLSLEGADGLEGNLFYAELLFELGVRFLGITWNYANWAADGVLESRNGGFTEKGRQLIEWCNTSGMLLDVSHLSPAGFWELAERSTRPFIASHSNAATVCNHPRNLSDEQIKALAAMDGRIGLTFVPWFVRNGGGAKADDLLKHIEHVCSLGGSRQLMFGSDFDGIDAWIEGLEHPGKYTDLADLLLKHYPEDEVKGWLHGNAMRFLNTHLPSRVY